LPGLEKNFNQSENLEIFMTTKIARFISGLFNPLIITTYYLIITIYAPHHFTFSITEKAKWIIFGLVFITTFLLPAIVTRIFGSVAKRSTKFDASDERNMLMSMASVFYFLTYYLLNSVQFSPIFSLFVLGMSTLIFTVLIINIYWKISAHMTASGAITGALAGISISQHTDMLLLIILTLLISGIIGFSRLKLMAHSPQQVYVGFGLGAITMAAVFIYF